MYKSGLETAMVLQPDSRVTSEILWQGALIFAVIDAVLAAILSRRITRERFVQLKWALVVTTAIFWCILWAMMSYFFWEPVYHYVFPEWARWFIPPVYGLSFAAVSLVFWWLSLRLAGHAVLNFFVLGGLWGVITHLWAISRGILEKPPLLHGASPLAAVVMPIFEFIFYWSIILTVALFLQRHHARWREGQTSR